MSKDTLQVQFDEMAARLRQCESERDEAKCALEQVRTLWMSACEQRDAQHERANVHRRLAEEAGFKREQAEAERDEAREMLRYPPKCGDCAEMKARLIDAQHDEALAIVTLTSTVGERADLRAKLNAAEGALKKSAWILRNDLYAVRVRNALEVLEGALGKPDEAGGPKE